MRQENFHSCLRCPKIVFISLLAIAHILASHAPVQCQELTEEMVIEVWKGYMEAIAKVDLEILKQYVLCEDATQEEQFRLYCRNERDHLSEEELQNRQKVYERLYVPTLDARIAEMKEVFPNYYIVTLLTRWHGTRKEFELHSPQFLLTPDGKAMLAAEPELVPPGWSEDYSLYAAKNRRAWLVKWMRADGDELTRMVNAERVRRRMMVEAFGYCDREGIDGSVSGYQDYDKLEGERQSLSALSDEEFKQEMIEKLQNDLLRYLK